MRKRDSQILDALGVRKKISVQELAELLNVSDVTIRKDLSVLESNGLLKREHGFAVLPTSDDVSTRLLFNYETKRRIARKTAESIHDGETLMIESGSCCALLAEEISTTRRDVTIITNSVFIANFVRHKAARIILLGGELQQESQVMVGSLVKKCAENFSVEKFFMGTDGFNERGAMSGDLMRAEAVRDMSESARRAIILTESKKFSQFGVVPLLAYKQIDTIFTDANISAETKKLFASKGVTVVEA